MPLSFQLTLECIVESYPEPYVVWRWEGKDKGTRGMITLGNSAKKYTQTFQGQTRHFSSYIVPIYTQIWQTMFSSQTGSCPKETVIDWVTPSQKLPTPCTGASQQSHEFGDVHQGCLIFGLQYKIWDLLKRHYTS